MADRKFTPVQHGYPTTEDVQRQLYGRHYDRIKKREQEAARNAPRQEPQPPYPSTDEVQRVLSGNKRRRERAAAVPKVQRAQSPKAVEPKPEVVEPPKQEHKATVAEPMRATYKTRDAKPEDK